MSQFCFYKASAFKPKKNIDDTLKKTQLIDKCCRIIEVFCIITEDSDLCLLSYCQWCKFSMDHKDKNHLMLNHVILMIVSAHMETINNSRPCGTPCWEDVLMENFVSLKFFVSLVLGWHGRRQEARGYCKDKGVFIKSNALTMCEPYQTKV